jgi:flagellar basal body-associated protein FliL
MGRSLVVALLALLGLLSAAGMGYAAYVVSRGSVAVPVTRLQRAPAANLTPSRVREHAAPKTKKSRQRTTSTTVAPPPPPPPTTTDDHGGSGHGGGGGHGSDD